VIASLVILEQPELLVLHKTHNRVIKK